MRMVVVSVVIVLNHPLNSSIADQPSFMLLVMPMQVSHSIASSSPLGNKSATRASGGFDAGQSINKRASDISTEMPLQQESLHYRAILFRAPTPLELLLRPHVLH